VGHAPNLTLADWDGGADTFEVEQLLELPPAEALPTTRLPCAAYPSDHFALLAVLHLGRPASL
jgi:hypothetical protein